MEALFYLADQNPHRDRSRGISEYSRALISNLRDFGIKTSAVTSKSSYQGEEADSRVQLPLRTDHIAGRLTADFLHPLWLPKVPLIHYPKGFLPGLRPRTDLLCGTVHDVILQHYADHYPHARRKWAYVYWLSVVKRSLARFRLIFTVSEFSAAAIRAFCSRHHLVCPPLRLTHEGCRWENEPWQVRKKGACVVHLASIEPHKRTETLVSYWLKLRPANLKLLLIGSVTNNVKRRVSNERTIDLLPALSSEGLKTAIAESRALILPSEIEGFGLPALESYAVGTPVVYVRETAVEEILGRDTPGGFYLNEPDSLSEALNRVLDLSPEQILRKRNELRARFSWTGCAQKTIAAYREFLGTS